MKTKHASLLGRRKTLALAGSTGAYVLFGNLGCGDDAGLDGIGGGSTGPGGPGSSSTGTGSGPGSSSASTAGTGSGGQGGEGGGGVGCGGAPQVGAYADLNLAMYPVYSIDMALQDYPQWTAHPDSGEVRVHEVGIWWDGGDALRTHPPTVEQRGSGIGGSPTSGATRRWRSAS